MHLEHSPLENILQINYCHAGQLCWRMQNGSSDLSIAEIASRSGCSSQSRFSSAFKAEFRTLPREYRKARL